MELILNGERVWVSLYRYAYKPYWSDESLNRKWDLKTVRPCEMAFARTKREPERYGMLVAEEFKPGDTFDPSDRVFLTQGRVWVYDDNLFSERYCPLAGAPMNEPEYEDLPLR
jgi:hypothetical protein